MFSVRKATKYRNAFEILELLLNHSVSRSEISEITGLTRTTVGNVVKTFIDLGFVEEKRGKRKNVPGAGRKPIPLEIIPSSLYAIGVGVLRHQAIGCLIDAKGKLLLYEMSPVFEKKNAEEVIKNITHVIDNLLEKANKESLKVKTIGLGIPGPLDPIKGMVLKPPKFSNFENIPLVQLLYDKYGIDVWIENDADMAALGEKRYGGGRTINNLIYIHISEGVGAGIIVDNHLYRGKIGYAGEVGHILLERNGNFVYFEDAYGMDVVIEKAKSEINGNISKLQDITERVKKGDKKAEELIKEIAKDFGLLILSLVHTLGIPDVFIGGKYQLLGDIFIEEIREIVKKYGIFGTKIKIQYSHLGDMAIPLGAASHAVVMYLKKLIIMKEYKTSPKRIFSILY
ncbi:ROK family transcriptional regulator [Thermotoga sp. KOL6]|uniref:ROK family transcriptional regulator n=1 Tax=Thermotoga sp. KOL6 TaxID=126741 RepID=UPI000C76DD29|nr:ROK family transcriptional regulator [Thermotoga sp. KOL6]PLV60047.1 hypothetical protein AS005_01795 [Thermotoga sp. KOL6]